MAGTGTIRLEESDALSSLEERIRRAAKLISELRSAKESAEAQARAAKAQVTASEELQAENSRLKQEIAVLQDERRQVRARIEKLLEQMDNIGS